MTQPSTSLPTWRDAFDAVYKPLAASAEAWVQTDTFMDALAVTWKIQRQGARRVEDATAVLLRCCGMPSRGDILKVSNQVASLERQVRELAAAQQEGS